jgi:ABC-type transport system substrate-binding protein
LIPDYYNATKYPAGVYGADGNITASSGVSMAAIQKAVWAKNATTVQFNLTGNDPAFVSRLAFNSVSIVSLNNTNAHSSNKPYSQDAFNYVNLHPVGTGAYKFKQFASGDFVSMERWDYYWNATAKIKNVLLKQVPTDNARVSGLISGDYDAAIVPRAQQQTLYPHADVVKLTNSSSFNVNFLGLNEAINKTGLNPTLNDIPSDFFKDVRVRQAFAHAWNFAQFNANALAGTAIQPNGVIPFGMFGYSADIPQYAFDLNAAKNLLRSVPLPPAFQSQVTAFANLIAVTKD